MSFEDLNCGDGWVSGWMYGWLGSCQITKMQMSETN